LLELLVSLLVVTLLLGGLYTVLFQTQTSFESQETAMNLRQQARVVVSQLSTELRMAGFGIGNLPGAITEARRDRLAFVADIDGGSPDPPCDASSEAAADGGAERIAYRLQEGDLLRSVDCWDGDSWSTESRDLPLARNVLAEAPLFRYYDGDDSELVASTGALTAEQRAAVRSIGIELALEDPNPVPGQGSARFSVRARVTLRNSDS
jgi:hypothetical protein